MKAVEIANLPMETYEEVMTVRKRAADLADTLYLEKCKPCTLLPEGFSKDRRNPICDSCETQAELWACGNLLESTLEIMRVLRKKGS